MYLVSGCVIQLEYYVVLYRKANITCTTKTPMRCCLSGRYLADKDEEGRIVLDRDGARFEPVLQYLRDDVVGVAEAEARSQADVALLRAGLSDVGGEFV